MQNPIDTYRISEFEVPTVHWGGKLGRTPHLVRSSTFRRTAFRRIELFAEKLTPVKKCVRKCLKIRRFSAIKAKFPLFSPCSPGNDLENLAKLQYSYYVPWGVHVPPEVHLRNCTSLSDSSSKNFFRIFCCTNRLKRL